MMVRAQIKQRARRFLLAGVALMSGFTFLFIPSCEGILTTFDPCGTILGNCAPGTFQLLFADVPDYSVDPTCTIPGGCADEGENWVDPFGQLGPGAWEP